MVDLMGAAKVMPHRLWLLAKVIRRVATGDRRVVAAR
jgi:hypothetical protein